MGAEIAKMSSASLTRAAQDAGLLGSQTVLWVRGGRSSGLLWASKVSLQDSGDFFGAVNAGRSQLDLVDLYSGKDQSLDISATRPHLVGVVSGNGKLDFSCMLLGELFGVEPSTDGSHIRCLFRQISLTQKTLLWAGSQGNVSHVNPRVPRENLQHFSGLCDLDQQISLTCFNLWASLRGDSLGELGNTSFLSFMAS